jgi:hypothetical protein
LTFNGGLSPSKEFNMDKEHVKGAAQKAKGAVKDAAGALTDDEKLQAKGKGGQGGGRGAAVGRRHQGRRTQSRRQPQALTLVSFVFDWTQQP